MDTRRRVGLIAYGTETEFLVLASDPLELYPDIWDGPPLRASQKTFCFRVLRRIFCNSDSAHLSFYGDADRRVGPPRRTFGIIDVALTSRVCDKYNRSELTPGITTHMFDHTSGS
ncbi:hypothetical protein NDU88_002464 [Pleurodeles waltl]|uniref:Uncharacterized protein n=1 Tax=Pleurodeles waltl TaxID=8319 RepID=A0AAV7T3B5_PLEWA|nr:hypothetical protein NDU88_002464 [Pleurodeles waltl]